MKNKIFRTNNDWTGFITRLTVGLILLPHGSQKVLGWFGGPGFTSEMNFFIHKLHLPWLIAFLVIIIEFFGAISLIRLQVPYWAKNYIAPCKSLTISKLQIGRASCRERV